MNNNNKAFSFNDENIMHFSNASRRSELCKNTIEKRIDYKISHFLKMTNKIDWKLMFTVSLLAISDKIRQYFYVASHIASQLLTSWANEQSLEASEDK